MVFFDQQYLLKRESVILFWWLWRFHLYDLNLAALSLDWTVVYLLRIFTEILWPVVEILAGRFVLIFYFSFVKCLKVWKRRHHFRIELYCLWHGRHICLQVFLLIKQKLIHFVQSCFFLFIVVDSVSPQEKEESECKDKHCIANILQNDTDFIL